MNVDKRVFELTVEELKILFTAILITKRPIEPPRFIDAVEAKNLLSCGDTQLYYYRVKGKISFVQDEEHPKMILYDRYSINDYLEKNLKKAF